MQILSDNAHQLSWRALTAASITSVFASLPSAREVPYLTLIHHYCCHSRWRALRSEHRLHAPDAFQCHQVHFLLYRNLR